MAKAKPAAEKTCDEDGCSRPFYAKGKCAAHYRRQQRHSPSLSPIRKHHPGGLKDLAIRISTEAYQELESERDAERDQSVYGKAIEILEQWAKRQRDRRLKGAA